MKNIVCQVLVISFKPLHVFMITAKSFPMINETILTKNKENDMKRIFVQFYPLHYFQAFLCLFWFFMSFAFLSVLCVQINTEQNVFRYYFGIVVPM